MGVHHRPRSHRWIILQLFVWCVLFTSAQAQACSSLNPCATGCCNKSGFCGIGDEYCGADVCVASCDYRPDCDASNPCATGCCNKYGYCGLGPDYCDAEVCVAGCNSRSYCDPGGFGGFAEVSKCPLNVCCSKFGFCGLTSEFCGDKKVKRPSCSKEGSLNRVVGYYEGWTVKRPCNVFYPEQIPMGIYTHLNYAFATIDPTTFEVLPASTYETKLMKRLTDLKRIDPDLKVFIAIGGWTFNDPGPTATVFSDLARSEENQKVFFKSLISFMSTYNFDGVDLDWEYPVADDRSGRPEDFKNFPKFMANLKKALKASGGRDGLSITLPASYWYLQHFDITELVRHVDFFNMMTYDLHGTWDRGNKWLGEYLLAHTNLTEITNALDLLWRNDIDPDKVVLGLAFYARAFTASDPGCMQTGCLFDSGANAGKCSHEVGILLNSEVMEIMEDRGLEANLDKDAAVKILTYDTNQWLTYDDADTFALKADFARSQCLGGLMVWAVSHDTKDATFSSALSQAAGRKAVSLAMSSEDPGDSTVRKVHPQCKWTNCLVDCPSGWSRVPRSDSGARDDEMMVDESGCDGGGLHQLCCPPDAEQPTCGWYTHHNGKCDPACPTGTVEVGSNSMYCNNGKYQAACCTTNTNSTKLYAQCSWAEAPHCDGGTCSNTEVAKSTTGSGGAVCYWRTANMFGEVYEYQERKYCCENKDDEQWDDCEWYTTIGLAPAGRSSVEGYCRSGCPDDRVRVAMDRNGGGCVGTGARSKCCKANFVTLSKRAYTGEEDELAQSVQAFMKDATCGSDSWYMKREIDFHISHGNFSAMQIPTIITRRSSHKSQQAVEDLLFALAVQYGASKTKQEIWDQYVVSEYKNLTPANVRDWIYSQIEGYYYLVRLIVCNMPYYDSLFGQKSVVSCECETPNCCDQDDTVCSSEEDYDSTESSLSVRNLLKKRAGPRPFDITFANGQNMHYTSLSYWSRGRVPPTHPMMQLGFTFSDDANCMIPDISPVSLTTTTRNNYIVEHELELNTIRQFIMDAAAGRLRSGAVARTRAISISFFVRAMTSPILTNPPVMAGGVQSYIPIVRVMNALGSTKNNAHFVFLLEYLNGLKLAIWVGNDPIDEGKMETWIESTDPKPALRILRSALSVIYYLNHPIAHGHWVGPANDVRAELIRAELEWYEAGNGREPVVAFWDEWLRDFMQGRANHVRQWVRRWAVDMRNLWAVRTGDDVDQTLAILSSLYNSASDLSIDMDGLHQEPID